MKRNGIVLAGLAAAAFLSAAVPARAFDSASVAAVTMPVDDQDRLGESPPGKAEIRYVPVVRNGDYRHSFR